MTATVDIRADTLCSLLRTEFDAIESYETAFSLCQGRPASLLRTICDEHRQAAEILRVFVEESRQKQLPPRPRGVSRMATRQADRLSAASAIGVLEQRERETIEEYRQAAQGDLLPDECIEVIAGYLLPQSWKHLHEVEQLVAHSSQFEGAGV